MKIFNESELKKYDGSVPGGAVYVAYKGKVYDVTGNPLFTDGMHFEHFAGADLTEYLQDAPHGEEVLADLTQVGEFKK